MEGDEDEFFNWAIWSKTGEWRNLSKYSNAEGKFIYKWFHVCVCACVCILLFNSVLFHINYEPEHIDIWVVST